MSLYKRDINPAIFEKAVKQAITEVDELKHATPQAKREMYDLLIRMRDSLIRWDEGIEVYAFMQKETR